MTRLRPVAAAEAGPLTRLAHRYTRRRFGAVPEPFTVMGRHPGVLWSTAAFESVVERTWTRLPVRLRELAVLRAALTVDCPWCVDFGGSLSERGGALTAQELDAVPAWRDSPLFGPLDRLVLAYAEAVSATPQRVTDEAVEELRVALGDDGLVELTAYVGLENSRARFNAALGIAPQGYRSGACRVPEPSR